MTSLHGISEYKTMFAEQFNVFARHIIPSWHLTNTKMEIMRPLERRQSIMFVVSDFAENVNVIHKHELLEQYFHRAEILLFGSIISFLIKPEEGAAGDYKLYTVSYMVSSDYK